jgi:predicted dehydrogenase
LGIDFLPHSRYVNGLEGGRAAARDNQANQTGETIMRERISRRAFNQAGATAVLGLAASTNRAASADKVIGANDRIRLGFIGVANRGGQLIDAFQTHDDMEIVALCDVDKRTLAKAKQKCGGTQDTYGDFRTLLDRKDIDAVVIATPDHWHAIQSVDACNAGKDVYVEKPVSLTVYEGRQMVNAARRTERVVQVGTHRRSGAVYAQAAELVQGGKLGKVTITRSYHRSNMSPDGMGRSKPSAPPADLDWDMWLGPRPYREFQDNIAPYKFRWWREYCCQISNNGVHSLDMIRWLMNAKAPASICCMGGKFAVDDDRTIPDTAHTIFQFPEGWLDLFGMYEASGYPTMARSGFVEIRGTQGVLFASDGSVDIVPERGGQFQDPRPRIDPMKLTAPARARSLTAQHAGNFLDCIRSREKPNADIEEGHRSTTMSLLSKISLAVQQRIEWDAEEEQITNCPQGNDMLHYEYRKPWTLAESS